jgi:hypothetical protein
MGAAVSGRELSQGGTSAFAAVTGCCATAVGLASFFSGLAPVEFVS